LIGPLRTLSLIALVVGASGSLILMVRAGRDTPTLLLVVFVVWVLSPFIGIAWAMKRSNNWSTLTRTTLHWTTLVIAFVSLAFYGNLIRPPAGSPPAFVFVIVPPVSLLVLTLGIWIAALRSPRR
jgi:hypothetical protein